MEAAVPDTFVVVDGVEVTLAEVEALLRRELKSETTRSILCDASHLESGTSLFSKGMCFVKKNTWSSTQLALLLRRLRPGGHIVFKTSPDDIDRLRRNCIFSGFIVSEEEANEKALLKAQKPEWDVGAKSQVSSSTQPPAKWTVAVDDDDDELLDDEAFLTEEDMKPAPVLQSGKKPVRKACDGCTCGAAEGKEPIKLTQEMLDNPVTACGSCPLGDAYRCASCPYRGLPAFEPGKKIELPEGFLISDV